MSQRDLAGIVLVGTKAQLIKMAPVLLEMDRRAISYRLVYTGQHSETFDELEAAFCLRPPDDRMVAGVEADTAPGLFGWALRFAWAALARKGQWKGAPWGMVHGDTASAVLGALALRHSGVPVLHVEAGLRSPRLLSPFPEEIIRRWVSGLATLHFAPNAVAAGHLDRVAGRIVDTGGNTLKDALRIAIARASCANGVGGQGGYAIASMHRSENLARRAVLDLLIEEIIEASRKIPVRFVLHPVTRKRLASTGWDRALRAEAGVQLLDRSDYPSFVALMVGASFLMTDGGSNQEEAAMIGLPTLLLRDATERPDGLGSNVVLSGLDREVIRDFIGRHLGVRWPIRPLSPGSPSETLVDNLPL